MKKVEAIPSSLLFSCKAITRPRFSPCKRYKTYIREGFPHATIWLEDQKTKTTEPLLTNHPEPIFYYEWTTESKHILILTDSQGDENYQLFLFSLENHSLVPITKAGKRVCMIYTSPKRPDTILFTSNERDETVYDVYQFTLSTHELLMIEKNNGYIKTWHPDSELIIRAAVTTTPENGAELLLKKSDSTWNKIIEWPHSSNLAMGPLFFTSDASYLYVANNKDSDTTALSKINMKTYEITQVAHDPKYDMRNNNLEGLIPLFTPPESYFFNEKGNLAAFSYYADRLKWHFIDESYKTKLTFLNDTHHDYWIEQTLSANEYILGKVSDINPPQYYHYSLNKRDLIPFINNQNILESYTCSTSESITIPTRDGKTIHGYLTLPPHSSSPPPCLIKIHGGPWIRDIWGFSAETQFLASRGYACLQINYRSSTGFGATFANAGDKQWGKEMLYDIEDAYHWLCSSGIVLTEKIGLIGRSYGGYAVLNAITTLPHLFACAIVEVAPTDLVLLMNTLPPYWKVHLKHMQARVGNPISEAKQLKEVSPLHVVSRIQCPLLFSHGKNDVRVKVQHALLLESALKKHHKSYTFMLFENEGHKSNKTANLISFYDQVEAFLKQHLL